ncbi:Transcription repressor OFP7 [Camellia lanceoleosa]|nr:Transcription repressor OFP7 [Camellia lanceoleosa]
MSSSLLLRCSTRWRQCKKKKVKIESPMRLSRLKESFVVKKSEDPYEDFKRSMIKMILEKQMFEVRDLEQLLVCFLSLNSHHHYRVIVEAFSDIWKDCFIVLVEFIFSRHRHFFWFDICDTMMRFM